MIITRIRGGSDLILRVKRRSEHLKLNSDSPPDQDARPRHDVLGASATCGGGQLVCYAAILSRGDVQYCIAEEHGLRRISLVTAAARPGMF